MHGKIRDRRAQVIRRRKRYRLYVLVGLVGITLLGSLGYGISRTSIFSVRKLKILGATPKMQASIDTELSSFVGKNLFSLESNVVVSKLERSPLISYASVQKTLPSELVVKVGVRTAVALVRTTPSSFVGISRSGVVFEQLPANSVPSLPEVCVVGTKGFGNCSTFIDSLSVGGRLPSFVLGALAVAQDMTPQELTSYRYVGVSNNGDLYLSDGGGFVCKLGDSSLAKSKLKLCDAMKEAFGSSGGPSYVDVSAPANPTVEPTSWLG